MRRLGAVIVDPVALPEEEDATENGGPGCRHFKFELNAYLASPGLDAPVGSLQEIIDSGEFHPTIGQRLQGAQDVVEAPEEQEACAEQAERDQRLRERVRSMLEENQLDAVVYPTWDNPPRLIGDLNSPHGNNSPQLSPPTGFPAVSVPMGFAGEGLPVGLQILGDAWSEPTLISIAYSYEQGTRHRVPPPTTPLID